MKTLPGKECFEYGSQSLKNYQLRTLPLLISSANKISSTLNVQFSTSQQMSGSILVKKDLK